MKDREMKNEQNLILGVQQIISNTPSREIHSGFNVFQVLGVKGKEVIMCRFLAELLNPNGAHNCGIVFLKSFCEDVLGIDGQSDQLLMNTLVTKEYRIGKDDRRIDIVISNYDHFIPIEVKIYAEDQNNQCFDYYQHAHDVEGDHNTKIVYLTRFADLPSEKSRGSLGPEKIKNIGWKKDILPWLDRMKYKADAQTRDLIEQYMEVLYDVSGGRTNEIMNQCVELITKTTESFGAAVEIERAVKEAKLSVMKSVFEEFKVQMEDEDRVRDGEKVGSYCKEYNLKLEDQADYYYFENSSHRKYYDTNSASTYPGLNYVVENVSFSDPNIQMWFRVEVDWNLFAGVTLYDLDAEPKGEQKVGNKIDPISQELYQESEQYIEKEVIRKKTGWWLTYFYPNGEYEERSYEDVPDFKNMNQCVIDLVDADVRKEYVKKALLVFEEKILMKLKG